MSPGQPDQSHFQLDRSIPLSHGLYTRKAEAVTLVHASRSVISSGSGKAHLREVLFRRPSDYLVDQTVRDTAAPTSRGHPHGQQLRRAAIRCHPANDDPALGAEIVVSQDRHPLVDPGPPFRVSPGLLPIEV
jgi:hypothetical protein